MLLLRMLYAYYRTMIRFLGTKDELENLKKDMELNEPEKKREDKKND